MHLYLKLAVLTFFLSAIGFNVFAQTSVISGSVTDESKNPLIGATVAILNVIDSSLVTGTTVDVTGNFTIASINQGIYLMKISSLGFGDLYHSIQVTANPLVLNNLVLKEQATDLNVVQIEGKIPPALQKGDTTQYNANAFKTNPDASAEDLITKMPGVTTQDGKVQAQGEDVKTVLVDGKPFFGDDPNAVLKNIPAEIIDNIQVFDRKSDQALFTGFDDGNASKTINIVTKPQFRNGTFGKAYAGYGDDDHYKAGAVVNIFKDKRRITLLAQSNNINEQNFSMEDLAGITGSQGNNRGGQGGNFGGGQRGQGGQGGRGQGGQGNDAGTFLVNQSNGINTTHALGLNIADQWKKLDYTLSYFFNYTGNDATTNLVRQYYDAENPEGSSYNEDKISESRNINHRANLKLDYKIDSLRSVVIQPKLTVQLNNGNSNLSGRSGLPGTVVSRALNTNSSELQAINFVSPIFIRNGFLKKGRTLSLTLTPGYNSTQGESYLDSYTFSYIDSLDRDSLSQLSIPDKEGTMLNANLTYTEPLNDRFLLNFTYWSSYNHNRSDKQTFNRQDLSGAYDVPDTSLTNDYLYEYYGQSLGGGIRYQKGKVNLTAGAAYQITNTKNQQFTPGDYSYSNRYYSVTPNAMLMIKFTEKKNLRINYRTSNNAPSIDQVQDVVNNTNPLQVSTGNPELIHDWQNNLGIRYSSANTAKNSALFFFLNVSYTKNYIGNATTIVEDTGFVINNYLVQEGAQVTQPVNLDHDFGVRSFINYSFAFSKIKSNVNLNAGGGFQKVPGLIEGTLNYASILTPTLGGSLTSNISKQVDFTLSTFSTLTFSDNSSQEQPNTRYLNHFTKGRLNVMPWKGLVIQTDLTHQYYDGLSDGNNENYLLWNAALGYKFLKKQAAELRFSVYDLLSQNKSITHNTTDLYMEDVRSNVLQRYFMLTFTYNLRFYKDSTDKR